jgi:hypothetical protein
MQDLVHVYLITMVILTFLVDQNVSVIQNVQCTKLVLI